MPFKVTDLHVGRRTDGTVNVYVDGLNTGVALPIPTDVFRAGLMLTVFNLRRDCYWDDGAQAFTTILAPWTGSPVASGRVTGWEIRVPLTGQPELFLYLIDPTTAKQTSGNGAIGGARLQAPEREIGLMLQLAQSRYAFFSQNGLRNTDVLDTLAHWPPG